MKAYCVSGDVTGGASTTLIAIHNTATRRAKLIQVIIGCSGAPADNAAKFAIRRITAADGTSSAGTEFSADGVEGAPVIVATVNYTVEPTFTAGNLVEISLNQRATIVWNAPLGGEIAVDVATTNGIGLQMIAGPALAYNATLVWDE